MSFAEPRTLNLSRGLVALVDAADYEALAKYKWSAYRNRAGKFYALRVESCRGKQRGVYLHRQIMRAERGQLVDHKNLDGLDNRRDNLRFCTKAQNKWNEARRRTSLRPYKGVCWDRARGLWTARIRANNRVYYLGRFSIPEEAAMVFDAAARDLHGEFARTNF